MSVRTSPWPAGAPCWADLDTPDVEGAIGFYERVLGWSCQRTGEGFGGYVIAQAKDVPAAGLGPQTDPGPPRWTMYVASDDVDATVARVHDAGGAVFAEPLDVGTLGRMAVVADPTGAAFGIRQAGEHNGASIVNEPGGLCWEDLKSTDPERAMDFYGQVFGHVTEPLPEAGDGYSPFFVPGLEGGPLGGMGGMETGGVEPPDRSG